MNRAMLTILLFSLISVAADGADQSTADPESAVATAPATQTANSSIENRPSVPEPVEEPLGCRNAFIPGPMALRPWSRGADRKIHPKSATPHFLDDCEPVGWTAGCKIDFGQQFCMNRQWTTICATDAQCPNDSRCTDGAILGDIDTEYSDYGWCAPSCDPMLGERTCARSDMECAIDINVCLRIDSPPPYSLEKHGAGPMEPKVRHQRMNAEQAIRPLAKRPSETEQ